MSKRALHNLPHMISADDIWPITPFVVYELFMIGRT